MVKLRLELEYLSDSDQHSARQQKVQKQRSMPLFPDLVWEIDRCITDLIG